MNFYSKKIINCKKADIHLHYANNKGRGRNNVTVTIVEIGTVRPIYTRQYGDNYIEQYRTSGWSGNVSIPQSIINLYGGLIATK